MINLTSVTDDVTLAVCPGIGNTSESVYIRTFVHYAQCHGYRCVVLNHLGALSSVAVTAPRVFTYGEIIFISLQFSLETINSLLLSIKFSVFFP